MLVWGLLWLVFGTRIGAAFSQETAFTLSLTLLAPLAAAWAVSRFGPRIILPIAVLALLPSIAWTLFPELWVRLVPIPVAFALLGVFGGGMLAARRAPETWLPLVRCSRAWLVVPAVALLWVGRAERLSGLPRASPHSSCSIRPAAWRRCCSPASSTGTADGDGARATLRSFGVLLVVLGVAWKLFAMGAFAVIVQWLSGSEALDLDAQEVALIVAGMTLLLLTPLAFIVNDALQRRDGARPVSALSGAVLALGLALVGALLGGFAVVPQELVGGETAARVVVPATLDVILALLATVLVTSARRVAAVAAGLLMLLLLIALGAIALLAMPSTERESEGNAVSTGLMVLAAAVFLALLVRGVRLRADLAGNLPRGLLFGEIAGGSFWARLACLMGMPASMWHPAALLTPAFWAFLLARPLVYVGAFGLWQGQALLGLCAIVGGHAAFAGGKRLAAREIWRVDAVYGSPPVLFLRSFEDDPGASFLNPPASQQRRVEKSSPSCTQINLRKAHHV